MSTPHLLAADKQRTPLSGTGFSNRCHTPYGALPSHDGPVVAYCGEPRDSGMDRYHLGNGHRVYNPTLMRFQSADRLSPFEAGGLNAYVYCIGDPINHTDSSGRASIPMLVSKRPKRSPQPQADVTFGSVLNEVPPIVAVGSAFLLALNDVSNRYTQPAADYKPLTASRQAGIATAFWVGVLKFVDTTGIVEVPDDLITGAALGSTGLNYWEMTRDIYQRMRSSEASVVGMLASTAYQVTGAKLLMDQILNRGNQIRQSDYEVLASSNRS